MTQQTQRSNLLGRATPYENQRYKADAEQLEAHDKAASEKANPDGTATDIEPQHNWEKRYKDLQSFNSRKINEQNAIIESLKVQGVQPVNVPKTQEELDLLRKQDPAGYSRIEAIATSMMQDQMVQYDTKLATVTHDLQETRLAKAELLVRDAHPDFDQIINSDQFHEWASAQDSAIQDWSYNNPNAPELAIKALSLYKFESGQVSTTNQSSTQPTNGGDHSVGVRTNTQQAEVVDKNHPTYIWKESEIARMRPEEFDKWNEHITLAQRENRILFGQ